MQIKCTKCEITTNSYDYVNCQNCNGVLILCDNCNAINQIKSENNNYIDVCQCKNPSFKM